MLTSSFIQLLESFLWIVCDIKALMCQGKYKSSYAMGFLYTMFDTLHPRNVYTYNVCQ